MGNIITASVDSCHDSNPNRTKSIRKMVRAIVKKTGGDGRKVKEEQMKGTSYCMGRVYFQGERVPQWDEGAGILVIKGSGKNYEEEYDKLMNEE